ncbi:MAG: PAS domain-containing sensor histidine kinase [Rhodospirillales bacterium]|nr:MAG: PAS domain-containing sensor histidine kinase [Rhodospirillales bacterium]
MNYNSLLFGNSAFMEDKLAGQSLRSDRGADFESALIIRSPWRLLAGTIAVIGAAEILVMVLMEFLPRMPNWLDHSVDALMLVVLIFPFIYFVVFRPFILHLDESTQIEASLRQNEAKLRQMLDTTVDAVIRFNPQGNIIGWNDQARLLFGWPSHEIMGRSLFDVIVPPRFHRIAKLRLERFLKTGRNALFARPVEVWVLNKSGREFPAELAVASLKYGGEYLFSAFVRDISKRKQAEETLLEKSEHLSRTNAELEQFAYIASHDLREPLRMISSYVSLLERRYGDKLDSDARDFIGFAKEGAVRMNSLILDLLEFSRVGRDALPLEPVSLDEVLTQSLANLKQSIAVAGAEIRTEGNLSSVLGHKGDLVRLFQNLISNAIKYRSEAKAPVILVSCRKRANQCVLSVKDNGIGIEPEYFERIFALFERLHGPGSYEGTGIGLAICKKIVERHHGRIWVESVPGQGSTFFFTLPLAENGQSPPALDGQSVPKTVEA